MIALQIEDIKVFMNKMFKDVTFDEFEVISMFISQIVTFTVEGALNTAFFDTDEQEAIGEQKYIKWADLKQTVMPLVKGNKTPTSMKIVFAISQKSKLNIVLKSNTPFRPEDVHGFYLNLYYESNQLKVVTGTNYKLFSLDKSVEKYFDDSIIRFFNKHEIPVTKIET
ncbi:MAG: hypothetical protein H7X94_04335 [Vallitaleaceae bacterium]|nr:hypothetical protein [Vallitaleaceae bacterium]